MQIDAMIFGAGKIGRVAYYYYKDTCNVVGYIDNDSSIWGTTLNGVPIYSPDVLKSNEVYIIIAVGRNYVKEIEEQLYKNYRIINVDIFSIDIKKRELGKRTREIGSCDDLIVRFMGNLGNQMFQYTVYEMFRRNNINVYADISSYSGNNILKKREEEEIQFNLINVFPLCRINLCDDEAREFFQEKNNENHKNEYVYIEPAWINLIDVFKQTSEIFNMKHGLIQGYFQTYHYPEMVKEKLYKAFAFKKGELKLQHIIEDIKESNSVSVHFRRGGYLLRTDKLVHGTHCDIEYYKSAIDYVKERVENVRLYLFSDDINWVKNNFFEENAIYIDSSMFDAYQDWYDMCLMSHCKHNIIANSTFSWWGAWLNRNPQKIVIAPLKWMARDCMHDICPPDWIRI